MHPSVPELRVSHASPSPVHLTIPCGFLLVVNTSVIPPIKFCWFWSLTVCVWFCVWVHISYRPAGPVETFRYNEEKTEVLVCAPDRLVPKVMETLGPLSTYAKIFYQECRGNFCLRLKMILLKFWFTLLLVIHSELEIVVVTSISSCLDF